MPTEISVISSKKYGAGDVSGQVQKLQTNLGTAEQNCTDTKKKCEMGELSGEVRKGQISHHINT